MNSTTESKIIDKQSIINEFKSFLDAKEFPCIAAKAALAKRQVRCYVAGHMACPKDDEHILQFLYGFVDEYKNAKAIYHSAAIIFTEPQIHSEKMFDGLLWNRLQAFQNIDSQKHKYDTRVDADPASAKFSFSIKEQALYVVGLHPASSRQARKFKYPALVFNPHDQFEHLRAIGKYTYIKNAVRKRDIALSGSVNPMLEDFGTVSEVFQYSGLQHDNNWQCPLKINHR